MQAFTQQLEFLTRVMNVNPGLKKNIMVQIYVYGWLLYVVEVF